MTDSIYCAIQNCLLIKISSFIKFKPLNLKMTFKIARLALTFLENSLPEFNGLINLRR